VQHSALEEAHVSRRVIALAAVLTGSALANTQTQTPALVTVSGLVTGASGQHTVHVAIWEANGFLETPVQESFLAAARVAKYAFAIPAGEWAVSAYEDRNENGELDMGTFGPKEPAGFWPPYHGRHRPHFAEVARRIDHDVPNADIALR
jgi:uncharacterized protein (DUF2141 family)